MLNEIFGAINKIKFGSDGDVVDRLHYKYTVFLLIFFALFLTTESLVCARILCFMPPEYPGKWMSYAKNLCWAKNTYYADMESDMLISEQKEAGMTHELYYYQYAALFLMLSAIMFYTPRKLWQFFSSTAGIDIDKMIETCSSFDTMGSDDKREKTFKNVATYMDRFLDVQGVVSRKKTERITYRLTHMCTRNSGNYLSLGYLLTKFVYLANACLQFTLCSLFLGNGVHFVDLGLASHRFATDGMVWHDSSRFPRVVYCDFKWREMGNVENDVTVQCLLPQNIYMEKVFVLVWWWYVMLIGVTALNAIQWTIRIYGNTDKKGYIKKYLQTVEKYPISGSLPQTEMTQYKKVLRDFVNTYLLQDGVFVIRIVSKNISVLIMSEIVGAIWQHFYDNYEAEMAARGGPNGDDAPLVMSHQEIDDEADSGQDSLNETDYAQQPTMDKGQMGAAAAAEE